MQPTCLYSTATSISIFRPLSIFPLCGPLIYNGCSERALLSTTDEGLVIFKSNICITTTPSLWVLCCLLCAGIILAHANVACQHVIVNFPRKLFFHDSFSPRMIKSYAATRLTLMAYAKLRVTERINRFIQTVKRDLGIVSNSEGMIRYLRNQIQSKNSPFLYA